MGNILVKEIIILPNDKECFYVWLAIWSAEKVTKRGVMITQILKNIVKYSE